MTRHVPLFALPAILGFVLSPAADAAPSTGQGQISVAQVQQMLDRAATDRTARQVLTAYLAGVGETAGAMIGIGGLSCRTSFALDAEAVRRVIGGAAARGDQTALAATPLIVSDMVVRAGCRRRP
jgi:hypothetical protein